MKIINIGSGRKIMKGCDNLDQHRNYGANIIWDLNKLPFLFKDNTYDKVYCLHVLEDFINPILLLDEFVRICKPKGKIIIEVPYFVGTWDSIHHQRPFTILSFYDYGIKETDYEKVVPINLKSCEFTIPYFTIWTFFFKTLFNFLLRINRNIIDRTMLRYFGIGLHIKVIFIKQKLRIK